mmetsp:Transcript_20082/g.52147  ORF Transcript_20082/g.52147 Transcript_20082/m.52147 type:complete len:216 (+) Transcript_20082:764-1411(+)
MYALRPILALLCLRSRQTGQYLLANSALSERRRTPHVALTVLTTARRTRACTTPGSLSSAVAVEAMRTKTLWCGCALPPWRTFVSRGELYTAAFRTEDTPSLLDTTSLLQRSKGRRKSSFPQPTQLAVTTRLSLDATSLWACLASLVALDSSSSHSTRTGVFPLAFHATMSCWYLRWDFHLLRHPNMRKPTFDSFASPCSCFAIVAGRSATCHRR